MKALCMLLLAGAAGVVLAQEPPKEGAFDIVRGNWTISSKNIEDGEWVTKHVEIYQNRTELTGKFQGPTQQGRNPGLHPRSPRRVLDEDEECAHIPR